MKINRKAVSMFLLVAVVMASLSVSAFAADSDIQTAITGAFQTMVTDMLATLTGLLPIAMTVIGASVSVAFAIKWFKKLTGKAG